MLAGHTCTPSTTQRYLQDREGCATATPLYEQAHLHYGGSLNVFLRIAVTGFTTSDNSALRVLGMDVERCSSPSLGPSSIEASWGSKRSPPSVIGADLRMNGDLISKSKLQVDGEVHGDIRGTGVVIGESADITGGIIAQEIIIRGQVMGPVRGMVVTLPVNGSRERRHLPSRAFAISSPPQSLGDSQQAGSEHLFH